MNFFLSILGSFISGPLKTISNDLTEAYKAKLEAKNDAERLAADERINILEARKSLIQSSQTDPLWRIGRALLAFPFIVYINKLLIWDKVLAWGRTDPLSADLNYILMMVVGSYFLDIAVRGFKK